MKLLATGDWHLDRVSMGVSRFAEIECAVWQTVHLAREKQIDLYAFMGDLADPDCGMVVFRCLKLAIDVARSLAKFNIPSIWLAGNHDVIEEGHGETTLTPMRSLEKMIVVVEKPTAFPSLDGLLPTLALPFAEASRTYDPAQQVRDFYALPETKQGQTLVLGHLTVPGLIPGEEKYEMPRGRDVMFPLDEFEQRPEALCINGHHHKQDTKGRVKIPGSLARLTFNEDKNVPGYLVIEVPT
jgi:DNA repair exonuclease SbcCD nuclease subunit